MPTPNLIQQQREIFRQFRTSNHQRTKAEADAESRCKAEFSAADAALNQIRQMGAAQVVAVQKAQDGAYTLLVQAGLSRLLEQTPLSVSAPLADADPGHELSRVVALAANTAKSVPTLIDALERQRKTDAARRKLLFNFALLVVIASIIAGYYWQEARFTHQAQATATAQAPFVATRVAQAQSTVTNQAKITATAIAMPLSTATARAKVTATAIAQAQAAATIQALPLQPLHELVGLTFVRVPAGAFSMGSPQGEGSDDEHPQHTLYLDDYWISQTEVTNAQYLPFVEAGGYNQPELWIESSWAWRQQNRINMPGSFTFNDGQATPDKPVVTVGWYEAVAYTRWLARETGLDVRLPTEPEWEKAACGKMLDIVGILEWTSSAYKSYPYQTGDDQKNLADEPMLVLRGGLRNDRPCADRNTNDRLIRDWYKGFRVVVSGN